MTTNGQIIERISGLSRLVEVRTDEICKRLDSLNERVRENELDAAQQREKLIHLYSKCNDMALDIDGVEKKVQEIEVSAARWGAAASAFVVGVMEMLKLAFVGKIG